MRRVRVPIFLGISILGLIAVGTVVYGAGHHRLGGVILAAAVIAIGLVIAPALGSQGRGAEQQGMLGRRHEIGGFDRPRDQSGL